MSALTIPECMLDRTNGRPETIVAAGMKVILSRKGFDSEYGRVPSPVLPDGRMISLPIPDRDAPTAYEAIRRDELTMADLVVDLGAKRGKPAKPIARTDFAHLDPDLDPDAVSRRSGWRPIFGQSGAALGHLTNEGVGVGDLFLFFGWFRPAEIVAGHWRYVRGSDSFHALWGWLLVGDIYPVRQRPYPTMSDAGRRGTRISTARSQGRIPLSSPSTRLSWPASASLAQASSGLLRTAC